jgi:hypothetical protein
MGNEFEQHQDAPIVTSRRRQASSKHFRDLALRDQMEQGPSQSSSQGSNVLTPRPSQSSSQGSNVLTSRTSDDGDEREQEGEEDLFPNNPSSLTAPRAVATVPPASAEVDEAHAFLAKDLGNGNFPGMNYADFGEPPREREKQVCPWVHFFIVGETLFRLW